MDTAKDRRNRLRVGMIFDETYRPFFEAVQSTGLSGSGFETCEVTMSAVATRTGTRAEAYRQRATGRLAEFASCAGQDSVEQMLATKPDLVCVATPENRHFAAAAAVVHVNTDAGGLVLYSPGHAAPEILYKERV